ncbi:hypothetical protein ACNFH8_28145 [Pseudomonas sp. NY15436]|uniref:hypothetical protein n=1 Tax=Pseudomonas sp. NY15436 TaxID=3400359 RepID=UPI003A85505E
MAGETGGLLDFVQSPMGMGLLSAAFGGLAGARRGAPLNSLGAAGLAGVAGYNAASANALKTQAAQMKMRQMQELPNLYGTDQAGNPTFDWKSAIALGVSPDDIAKYGQAPNAGKTKVARTLEVPGINGTKQTIQLDEFGNRVGDGIDSYVAPQLVDLGGSKQFVTPTAGQGYAVSMSPAELAANARGWAGIENQRQQNAIMQDANNINRQAQRTQIVVGADGKNYLIDKGTGSATPAVTELGAQVMSGPLAEATAKNQQNMQKLGGMIQEARKILPDATSSGLGAIRDTGKRFFGKSSPEAQAAAKLGVIGGNMLMFMPRMEGPQSDRDVENYKAMAGKVSDPTIPVEERMAALDAMQILVDKYSGQTQQPAPAQPQPKQAVGTYSDPDKEARYQAWKRQQGMSQ